MLGDQPGCGWFKQHMHCGSSKLLLMAFPEGFRNSPLGTAVFLICCGSAMGVGLLVLVAAIGV